MTIEQFVNGASTTLSGNINSSVTSLTVASASGFPSGGNFRIIIDSEIMLVTAVSGTTFTVTRGADSTSAASHTSGASILAVITAGALTQFRGDSYQSDVIANIPSAGNAGTIYFPTDLPIMLVDNGSSWDSWLCEPLYKLTPPPTSGWSWVNQGSATVSYNTYNTLLTCNNSGINVITRSYPSTPWKIDVVFDFNYVTETSSNLIFGFVYMDNTNAFTDYEFLFDTAGFNWGWMCQINSNKYTSGLGFSGSYFGRRGYILGYTKFIRFGDDGTNRYCSLSADGQNYVQIHSVGRTDYITPTKVGVMISNGNAVPDSLNILSWYQH